MEDRKDEFPSFTASELMTSLVNFINEKRTSNKEQLRLPTLGKAKISLFPAEETPVKSETYEDERRIPSNYLIPEYISILSGLPKKDHRGKRTVSSQKASSSKKVFNEANRYSKLSNKSLFQQYPNLGLDFALPEQKHLAVLPYLVSGKNLLASLPESTIRDNFNKKKISPNRFHLGVDKSGQEIFETQLCPAPKPQRHKLPSGVAAERSFENLKDLQWKLYKGILKKNTKSISTKKEEVYKLDETPFQTQTRNPQCFFIPLISIKNTYVSQTFKGQ